MLERLKLYNKTIKNASERISELLGEWRYSKAESVLEMVLKIRESCDFLVFFLNNSIGDGDANSVEPEKDGRGDSGEQQKISSELDEWSKLSVGRPKSDSRPTNGVSLDKQSLDVIESTISMLLDSKLSQLLPQPQPGDQRIRDFVPSNMK